MQGFGAIEFFDRTGTETLKNVLRSSGVWLDRHFQSSRINKPSRARTYLIEPSRVPSQDRKKVSRAESHAEPSRTKKAKSSRLTEPSRTNPLPMLEFKAFFTISFTGVTPVEKKLPTYHLKSLIGSESVISSLDRATCEYSFFES